MDARIFAHEWQRAWNSHDLDRIMAHFRDDVIFRSNKAVALVGAGEIHGKADLRAYWKIALDQQKELRFEVQELLEGYRMAVITYTNHRGTLAAETFVFDEDGRVYLAAACHQANEWVV